MEGAGRFARVVDHSQLVFASLGGGHFIDDKQDVVVEVYQFQVGTLEGNLLKKSMTD